MLAALPPTMLDLLAESDSGLFNDDNLTNIREATIEITAAQTGDAIRVYRDDVLLGEGAHIDDTLYRYTFVGDELVEGVNAITARSFDGVEESPDSPTLVITLDTLGPQIVAIDPGAAVDLRTSVLDSVAVTFNEPIDAASFTIDDITILGPSGTIVPTGITSVADDQFRCANGAWYLSGSRWSGDCRPSWKSDGSERGWYCGRA